MNHTKHNFFISMIMVTCNHNDLRNNVADVELLVAR